MTNYKSINTIPSLDKEDSDGSYIYLILINHKSSCKWFLLCQNVIYNNLYFVVSFKGKIIDVLFIIKSYSVNRFNYQGPDHLWSVISER